MIRRELTDAQWRRIEPLIPGKEGDQGRHGEDNRLFVDAVLWLVRAGAPYWRASALHLVSRKGQLEGRGRFQPLRLCRAKSRFPATEMALCPLGRGTLSVMLRSRHRGPPMPLGNMRANSVRSFRGQSIPT